jgi:hypothetical protein
VTAAAPIAAQPAPLKRVATKSCQGRLLHSKSLRGGGGKCYGNVRSIGTRKGVDCGSLNKEGTMTSQSAFAEVAALAGDPARAGMLHALMDGRALTASELARVAGITSRRRAARWHLLGARPNRGLLSVREMRRCGRCFGKGWIRRNNSTRAVTITPKGRLVFRDEFDVLE